MDVDVSEVKVDIQFERFEEKLATATSPEDLYRINRELMESGGELYEFYVYDILSSALPTDDSIGHYLWYFQSDKYIQKINEDIAVEFSDISALEDQITDMFRHLKYHVPSATVPGKVVTYNSAFRYGVVSTPEMIGIGLDMYLGEDNRNVEMIGFPAYMKAKMDRQYLPVDIAHSWLITNVMNEGGGETFLSNMIYYGKLRYLIDAMMPDLEDHLKMRYTKDEYEFALASEWDVWQYLVDMDWIYTSELKVLMRFFEEAPTTVGIEGSPARIGQFMGWRIVRQYMEKNPEVTVEQLLKEEKESVILKAYKPIK